MTSPPSKHSKRKRPGKIVQEGVKRFRTYLQPPSSDDEGTSTSPLGPASASSSRSATPSRSASAQPVTPQSQAANSTDSSAGTDAVGSRSAPSATGAGAKHGTTSKLKRATTSGLVSALQALHISADLIPPLKPAISGLVECLDVVQAVTVNAEEYDELTSKLGVIAGILKGYLGELGLETASGNAACGRIAASIQAEVAHIKKQQTRSTARQIAETADDKQDIIRCYRRVEELFSQLQSEVSIQTLRSVNKQHMTTLLERLSPADDARFNSGYSTTIERRGCTKETREQVQADLREWAQDPNGAKVYWMNGMAGTGKTTIAYSLCEWLEADLRLGASFFCSRASPSCRNVNSIIPTIAYELARYSWSFRAALCGVLEKDPGASKLNVVQQFEKLVRDPLGLSKAIPVGVIIVIDALDECEGETGVRLVLQVLLRLSAHLPLKFFVTSRPEPTIRDKMLSPSGYPPTILHLHDIEQSIVEGDIKKYLAEELELMLPPPTDGQIARLAQLAGKLFIYAATVTRYILPGISGVDPVARLNSVLKASYRIKNQSQTGKKYQQLDELYTTVLAIALDEEKREEEEIEIMHFVLWTVVCAKEPMTIATLASFLHLTERQVLFALEPLRSVLHISEPVGLVSTFHASFPDYVHDRSRSGKSWCNRAQHEELMASRCFEVMDYHLRFNICKLESSFVLDRDITDLEQRIRTNISPTLVYACLYWGDHLSQESGSGLLCDKLVDFLAHRLLFWMEVLNLKRCVVRGISSLSQGERWLQAFNPQANAQRLAFDAVDFVTRFAASACSNSTPHIYISALPFCGRSSSVYRNYYGRTRGLVDLKGTVVNRQHRPEQAAWATDHRLLSLGFSIDGTRLASGNDHGTIHVRDAHTGEVVAGPFVGHMSSVHSVVFSPDSLYIASGSSDRTIRVWDAYTSDPVAEPFHGHTSTVNSIGFSPDGNYVVSGSDDQTIRVWDARTGSTIAKPFQGHMDRVNSVGFSRDGTRVVSGSDDRTIRVWDSRTGEIAAGPFNGHTSLVSSVMFSPDGTRVVSGSADQTIRVWNAQTGDIVTAPFEGHTGPVSSVAFSPDGMRIASGSYDMTVRMWNIGNSDTTAIVFQGHTSTVNSVIFSPTGTHVISGSGDRTIRVWNIRTSKSIATSPRGHASSVNSVAFSPDGTRIVSGSDDLTVRVWDAYTGDAIFQPLRGHTHWVNSVAFSSDGTCIASGSEDNTIRVWDARTGSVSGKAFHQSDATVKSVAFSPDGTFIVSVSGLYQTRFWDAHTSNVVIRILNTTSTVKSLALSADGTRVALGTFNIPRVIVSDAHTGNPIVETAVDHGSPINAVSFSPDGMRIVSGSADLSVRIWDTLTGNAVAGPLLGHTGSVSSVAFTLDGTRVISGSDDSTIRIWDARAGDTIAAPFQGHISRVRSLAVTADGTRVVSGSDDQVIRVWDIRSYTGGFRPNKDGWFTSDKGLLLWVPLEFHSHLPHPSNTLLIGPEGTAFIDYRYLLLGRSWSECYVG